MKRIILTLLLTLVLVVLPVNSLMAEEEVTGGVESGGTVENAAPVIEEGSLTVQIIDNEGTAWGWAASGNTTGNRTAPYILKGEQLNVTLEVTDTNGEADLTAMVVRMNLSANISFNGTLVSLIDPDTGRYSGSLTVDESLATGKYDLTIDVTDPTLANDTYDVAIYQPGADILKPELSLTISASQILFRRSNPGDQGVPSFDNPVHLTPLAVIGEEHVPVVFSVWHSSGDMVNGENIIPASATVWSMTDNITSNSLDTLFQIITIGVAEGTTIDVYYWLNVPSPLADGDYRGRINYRIIGD